MEETEIQETQEQQQEVVYQKVRSQQPKRLRQQPQSELDYQLMTTDPKWGDFEIPDELREILGDTEIYQDENGKTYVGMNTMWGLLGFYTRDLRLGNLGNWSGEIDFVERHIDYAGDCITGMQIKERKRNPDEYVQEINKNIPQQKQMHFVGSFMRTFRPAITKLEVSQSRGGFLRKRQGTLTSENIQSELEPKKRGLLTKKGGSQ